MCARLSRATDELSPAPPAPLRAHAITSLMRLQGPDDLPRTGWTSRRMRPFDPPGRADWWREHWRPIERWDDDKITAALREFIGDRAEWPTQYEFHWRHKGALLDAVYCRGGSIVW